MEKISKNIFLGQGQQKHLHVRGENFEINFVRFALSETPPHTWRKLLMVLLLIISMGNTSTYVEKMAGLSCS